MLKEHCCHGNQYLACCISPSIFTARKLFREAGWMTSTEQETVPFPGSNGKFNLHLGLKFEVKENAMKSVQMK